MASIFARIAAGEIPSYRVAEDDRHFAFLDINPMTPGHVLVIPKKETDYIFDIADSEQAPLWQFAVRVARALKAAVPCKRVAVAVLGMEVPHAHIHLIPINKEADVDFHKEKLSLPDAEMKSIAEAIAREFTKAN